METGTLGLDYETILHAYNNYFGSAMISSIIMGLKFFAIALFAFSLGSNMISKMGSRWGVGEIKDHLDTNKVKISFIFILVIAGYDYLLYFLDNLFIGMDSYFSQYNSISVSDLQEETIEEVITRGWTDMIKDVLNQVQDILNGVADYLILGMLTGILAIIDQMIYIVFLIERFFFLGLLKILGPIAILFSIYKAKTDYFDKWLKLYISTYLLIIPLFLVIGFTGEIIKSINHMILQNPVASAGMIRRSMLTIALILIIWIKLRLFKKAYEMVYKVLA